MPNGDDTAGLYLLDLGYLPRDMAFDVKARYDAAKGSTDEAEKQYLAGKLMAFLEVISLMQDQASVFGIPLKDLSLEGVDPERDLL